MIASTAPDLDAHDLQIAAAALLESVRRQDSPLRAISDALGDLASKAGANHAVLGINDAKLGRQVFSSNRTPLDANTGPLFGPASLITEPPTTIDPDGERLLIVAAELAFASLHQHLTVTEPRVGTHLRVRLDAAAAAASRFGWGFALVLAQCGAPHAFVEGAMAYDDDPSEVYRLDDYELAVILPSITAAEIPSKLGQIAQCRALPTLSFGVAMCPADGSDASTLLAVAATRLQETLEMRAVLPERPSIQSFSTVPSAS